MRSLNIDDLNSLQGFFEEMPAGHVKYFKPHGYERSDLRGVLESRAFLTYGLFIGDEMKGYALLKVAPTGSLYIGRLLHPSQVGQGLGAFLSRYLYWQASLAGLRARSTISRHNIASLRSHQAVANFNIISELPNDYLLIEFEVASSDKPELSL